METTNTEQHAGGRIPLAIACVATLAAWVAWGSVVVRTNPDAIGVNALALFYLALLAAVSGTATIVGLAVRRRSVPHERGIRIAVRQGILIGCAVAAAVLLQSRGLLTWFNLLALIAALTLLELFWISLAGRGGTRHTGGVFQ